RVPEGRGFPVGFAGVSHVGPITRTVRDAALVLDVIAGGDDLDRHSLPREAGSYLEACDGRVNGLNVAWSPDLGSARLDPRVLARGARVPRALRPPPDADRGGAPVRRGPGAAARDRGRARLDPRLDAVHVPVQPHRPTRRLRARGLDRRRAAGWPADRGSPARRRDGPRRLRGLRGGAALERAPPRAVRPC